MMDRKVTSDCSNCLRLQQENARLKELLTTQNISWDTKKPNPETIPSIKKTVLKYSPEEKIALFRRFFCGRTDVYPVRWESKKGGAGYSPACENEWRPGVCEKPRVKCGACKQRKFLPVTDRVIYNHLSGQHTIGVYPLLKDDSCYFLATDFDESSWQGDALAFMQSCKELDIPASLEISRSGQGAHTWIFFLMPFLQPKPENLVQLLSVIHVLEPGNSHWTAMIVFSRIKILFPREGSVT